MRRMVSSVVRRNPQDRQTRRRSTASVSSLNRLLVVRHVDSPHCGQVNLGTPQTGWRRVTSVSEAMAVSDTARCAAEEVPQRASGLLPYRRLGALGFVHESTYDTGRTATPPPTAWSNRGGAPQPCRPCHRQNTSLAASVRLAPQLREHDRGHQHGASAFHACLVERSDR